MGVAYKDGCCLERIRYVAIECLASNADTKVGFDSKPQYEAGLFKGIKSKGKTKVIILADDDKDKAYRILRYPFYKIISIEIRDETKRDLLIFRSLIEEQTEAFEILEEITKEVGPAKKDTNDKEMLDTTKFFDYKDSLILDSSTTTKDTGVVRPNIPRTTATTNTSTGYNYTTKYEEERKLKEQQEAKRRIPTYIERDEKEAAPKELLDYMKSMVISIREGKYNAPEVKLFGDTKEHSTTGTSAAAVGSEDDAYGNVWGCMMAHYRREQGLTD